jgi:Fe-Mn family superoxide dismutase
MKPNGGGTPPTNLLQMIESSFGSFETFKSEFSKAGLSVFGSGWVWLVYTPSGLKITKTIGANCPLTDAESIPLLTMDVWEHAYYLKYKNVR